jgi:hypothetical protein
LESGFKKSAEFDEIRQNSTDSVVADFSKIGTVQAKFGIVRTKIGIVYPKFGEKIGIGRVQFFSTHRIFKHCLELQEQAPLAPEDPDEINMMFGIDEEWVSMITRMRGSLYFVFLSG